MPALLPALGHVLGAKLDSIAVTGFVQTVRGEQDTIAGRELHQMLVVVCAGKHSRGQSTLSQCLAFGFRDQQGQRKPGVGECQFAAGGVEDRIQSAAKPGPQRPLRKPLIERGFTGKSEDWISYASCM